jgi:RsiW-degrading membrane proteinase PrsW (M82 family)
LQTNSVTDSLNIVYGVLSIGFLHMMINIFPLDAMFFGEKIIFIFPNGATYEEVRPTIMSLLCLDFFQIGLPEELAKFSALALALYLDPPKTRSDSIYRGACVGLGFAMVENYKYIVELGVPLETRLLLPTLLHASLGVLMGFYLFGFDKKMFYTGLAICTFIHGAYDFSCMINIPMQISMFMCIFFLGVTILAGEKVLKKSS